MEWAVALVYDEPEARDAPLLRTLAFLLKAFGKIDPMAIAPEAFPKAEIRLAQQRVAGARRERRRARLAAALKGRKFVSG